jgi:RHS repeat-associated protein
VLGATYVIDGQNRRIGKKVNGVMVEGFLYRNQLQPAAWLNGDGTVRARFVYGGKPNVPEYMVTSAGATYRLVADQVSSVRLIIDNASGTVVERIDQDEFGNVLSDTAPGAQPFGFAGGLRDLDASLTRFGARDYDPVTGRWMAKDPVRFGGRLTNLYSYGGGDSLNKTDPAGLATCYYSIGAHSLVCLPNSVDGSPGQGLGPVGVFSGLFGCRNNPSQTCTGSKDIGPIVPGKYQMHPDDRPGHEKFWRLEPIPKVPWWKYYFAGARSGFELHPGSRSLGCITTDKSDPDAMWQYDRLNDFLLNEGNDTLEVRP